MSLRLAASFGYAELHGEPTVGLRRFGVPPGGAFDLESCRLALALVQASGPAWEVAFGRAEFVSSCQGTVGIAGGVGRLVVNGKECAPDGCRIPLQAGSRLVVEVQASHARLYVAFVDRALPAHRLADPPRSLTPNVLRVVPGPQFAAVDNRLEENWTVTPVLDRMGIRLSGEGIPHAVELPSEPACPGTVQVTPDGNLVILGPDGPTIGGYPKAAVVCTADLPKLGQLAPGQRVSFQWITLNQARALRKEVEAELDARLRQIRLVS